ncbi:hypothetical protein MA03_07965 [Infirmifilum uzonense]|jgi:hypothetical protein|uniref:Uncharacterized protein n=2 Tax=Thermofilaceae TaxID=114378 RepID=A0A0F7FJG8_9CREN|nr:hypothetical protein MA03_07965 [Infirmifilum uzonense]
MEGFSGDFVSLTGVERFVLAYIYYEYGGKIYFQASSNTPEEYLAEFITEEFLPRKNPNFARVVAGFAEALRGLKDKGYVSMTGYEVNLTDDGKREAMKVPQEEYRELKRKFTKV